jgi:hypothetical protein
MDDIRGEEWFCRSFLANCGPHRPQLLLKFPCQLWPPSSAASNSGRRDVAEILPKRRKTLINQSINLILDSHSSREVLGLLEAGVENDIHILALPPHTSSPRISCSR